MKQKIFDYDSYRIYTIETDKFKNCYMEINFRDDVRKVKTPIRSFLCSAMSESTLKYKTKRNIRIACEELYNVELSSRILRNGYTLFTNFSVDFLNPKYVKEKGYLENVFSFFFEGLMNPDFTDNHWNENSFQLVKEKILSTLDVYKERPRVFAMIDGKEKLFPNSIPGKRIVGTREEIEKITEEDLIHDYHEMMNQAHCDILVIGNLNMNEVASYIHKYFHKSSIAVEEIPFRIDSKFPPFRKLEIESNYNQTQLVLFYHLKELTRKERYFVMPIFRRIFSSASLGDKLNLHLRVENSLCYDLEQGFQYYDSFAYVRVGLSLENVEIALKEIRRSMKEMLKKEIREEFFESQKEKFLKDLKLREDNMYGLLDFYYFEQLEHAPSVLEYKKEIPKVTLKDIQIFGKKMEEVLLYILKEKKE